MIPLDEARALLARTIVPLEPARCALAEAAGRVLREDVLAPEDLPAFDRAAMDGYALGLYDASAEFRIVAEIQPGMIGNVEIGVAECARVFTGAEVPAGASQVVMQEDVQREGDRIKPLRRSAATHIRRRGEDARAGQILLAAGTRLGPAEAALLAQIGAVTPSVSPRPRVLHLTTGNELVDPAARPGPGQIRDSNSTLIAALLAERGAVLAAQRRCGDSLEALVGAVTGGGDFDVLLVSGGASVGDYDFGARALERLGFTIHFRKLNLRPGKPLIFAQRDRQVAFVIPGNPVSHFVTFHVAIAHAFECLERSRATWPLIPAALAAELPSATDPRETWWPARVAVGAHGFSARPLAWQSSGDLCGIASANALLRIPPELPALAAGASVGCLLLDRRF